MLAILRASVPPRDGAERAWIAQILRRQRAHTARAEIRRRAVELTASRAETAPPAVDEVAAAMTARDVRHCLQKLREPYRTTLVLRYFEGLPPREIARHEDITIRTVNKRIERGLKLLRAALVRQRQRDWRQLLLPGWLLRRPPTVRDGRPRPARWRWAIAAIGGVATLWTAWPADPRPGPPLPRRAAAGHPVVRAVGTSVGPAGAAAETGPPAARRPADTSAPAVRVTGRVVDVAGTPAPGLTVQFEAGAAQHDVHGMAAFAPSDPPLTIVATSGPDGAFALPLEPDVPGRILAHGAGYAPLLGLAIDEHSGPQRCAEIVVGRAQRVRGRVIDDHGGRYTVALAPPPSFVATPLARNRSLHVITPRCRTNADGTFEFSAVAVVEGGFASVFGASIAEHHVPLQGRDLDALQLMLPLGGLATVVSGLVVDADQHPIADAVVGCGAVRVRTAANGTYRVKVGANARRIWAARRGYCPDRRRLPRTGAGTLAPIQQPLVLRIQHPTRTLRGRVQWRDGSPAKGAVVFAENPVIAGPRPECLFFETIIGAPGPSPHRVVTDARGAFELDGLMDRRYKLVAIDPTTLAQATLRPVPAGQCGVTLEMKPLALAVIHGRVTYPDGTPAARVPLTLRRVMMVMPFPCGEKYGTSLAGPTTATDADGHFELRGPRAADLLLAVAGANLSPRVFPVDTSRGDAHREVVVSRRVPVCIRLLSDDLVADEFELHDRRGRRQPLWSMARNNSKSLESQSPRATLRAGEGRWVVCPESTRKIVFFHRGEETARRPLALVAGCENVLDF